MSEGSQLVIHNNLHRNIHYSVSDKRMLRVLDLFCKFNDIKIAVYKSDRSYTKADNIIVINKFSDEFQKVCYNKLKPSMTLGLIKELGKFRENNTKGWSIAPSGSYAGGWRQPHPELNKFCTSGKLNKEGYNTIFPHEIKEGLPFALTFA